MTAEIHERENERQSFSLGTILFGLILLFIGALWLLDVIGVVDVTWTLVGSGTLILIGLLLIVGARGEAHGGMVFLGVVLSAIVLLGSIANWPSMQGGVGDQIIVPESFTELEDSYRWSLGTQTLDLRAVEFPEGETEISVQHGTGDLEIRLPEDVGYRIEWSVGVGDAQVMETNRSGVSLSGTEQIPEFEDFDRKLVMTVQLGIGALEVRQ